MKQGVGFKRRVPLSRSVHAELPEESTGLSDWTWLWHSYSLRTRSAGRTLLLVEREPIGSVKASRRSLLGLNLSILLSGLGSLDKTRGTLQRQQREQGDNVGENDLDEMSN